MSVMTSDEYRWLREEMENDDFITFHDTGLSCYELGYVDNFGLITPKGMKDMEEYERTNHPIALLTREAEEEDEGISYD